jgi:CheY-like chemotaxis protein
MQFNSTQIVSEISKASFEKNIAINATKKILVIEDDPISAATLESLLRDVGFSNITITSSGKEAIKLFSKNHDLIFCDINLPDINGLELTRHFRKNFPKKDTPIICCSTDIEKHRRECIEAGMDDFLSKPLSPDQLQEILECWLPAYRNKILNQPDKALVFKE